LITTKFNKPLLKLHFRSTHVWGENPRGKWRLVARFQGPGEHHGVIKKFTLMLHGTKGKCFSNKHVNSTISDPPYAGIKPLEGHTNGKPK
jgi:proprotein convertase subtilisin/kexin type 2